MLAFFWGFELVDLEDFQVAHHDNTALETSLLGSLHLITILNDYLQIFSELQDSSLAFSLFLGGSVVSNI